ncbi:MAG: molybdenum cofactor biosynthesis protein MoaE [Bryobacterales bacterium]|nr:molybdenum cofactor biosynthesis protein MoaE [Acidobacteriota bacterium]MCB9384614.1 molybdenum cofactor biosynthesis protein MoaE [Bryobacterales bacterium]
MRVQVLFFGQLKDIVGRSSASADLPEDARVETLFARFASEYPKLRQMASSIAMARNQEFVTLDEPLADGDEVAFMPPVSGGSGWIAHTEEPTSFYAITEEPLDPRALVERLQTGADGAVITFEGVTRNNTKGRTTLHLDYECYAPMALAKMQQIGGELLEKHGIRAIGFVHRVGRLAIQEASVVIVVCSAHRQAAYDASLEAINRLKTLVPIWKKETFADGEVWVEGAWDDAVPRSERP